MNRFIEAQERDYKTAEDIFGDLDAMKVKSCMTLFDTLSPNDIFDKVLDRFYGGKRCELTQKILTRWTI